MAPHVFGGARGERVEVLHVDRDMALRLDEARRVRAAPLSVAAVMRRGTGSWDTAEDAERGRSGFGLLIVDGMLVRRVGLRHRYGAELLSAGDVLQPWEHDGEGATLSFEATWRVLAPLRMAVLDLDWAARMGAFPEVATGITARVMQRSRRLATMLAIAHFRRLEDRLLLLLWELADRFGRVTPSGVVMEIRLTQELLSYLACAQRSSVSTALTRLERDGRVRRESTRWMLLGEPPATGEFIGAAEPGRVAAGRLGPT